MSPVNSDRGQQNEQIFSSFRTIAVQTLSVSLEQSGILDLRGRFFLVRCPIGAPRGSGGLLHHVNSATHLALCRRR